MEEVAINAITLRNIPPDTAQEVELKAQEWDLSLNKTVLRLLERALGVRATGQEGNHELDELVGVWSPEEARDFDKILADQRRIDEELWR